MKRRLLVVLCLLALLTGCGLITQPAPTPSPTLIPTPKPPPYAEYLGYFQQELLFIQQGLRQHDIDQSFTVYFAAPDFGKQCIALDDGEGIWEESFSFVYDKELRWFTFSELYEPVLTQNIAYRTDRDDWAEFLNTAIYKTELSADTELAVPIRFDIPNGPQEQEIYFSADPSQLYDIIRYEYNNPRLGAYASIYYPKFTTRWETPDWDAINGKLKSRVFCGPNRDAVWHPEDLFQQNFSRECRVTVCNPAFISAVVWTYGADHAKVFGMTMDLETKQFLTLGDIIGTKTIAQLLDSGAFQCVDMDDARQAELLEKMKSDLNPDSTSNFYLTEDTLGLIGVDSNFRFTMEAPLSALGLSQWIQTDS